MIGSSANQSTPGPNRLSPGHFKAVTTRNGWKQMRVVRKNIRRRRMPTEADWAAYFAESKAAAAKSAIEGPIEVLCWDEPSNEELAAKRQLRKAQFALIVDDARVPVNGEAWSAILDQQEQGPFEAYRQQKIAEMNQQSYIASKKRWGEFTSDRMAPQIGAINGVPVAGPITRAKFYTILMADKAVARRAFLKQRRAARRAARLAHLRRFHAFCQERARMLRCKGIINFGLRTVRPKAIPNVNCKNTSVKQTKTTNNSRYFQVPEGQLYPVGYVRPQPITKGRDQVLLARLRAIIATLRARRASRDVYRLPSGEELSRRVLAANFQQKLREQLAGGPILAQPQADDTAQDVVSVDQKSNVALIDQSKLSTGAPITPGFKSWTQLISTEPPSTPEKLADRWLLVKASFWSTDNRQDGILESFICPKDIVNNIKTSPLVLMLKQHLYSRFDMEIKVELNSNKFQTGQLLAGWYYNYSNSGAFKDEGALSAASMTQMQHAKLSAGAVNTCTLKIPFLYPYVYFNNRSRDDADLDPLNMGKFYLIILNKLQASSSAYNKAHYAIFVRFSNIEYIGMVDTSLALPNMETAATLAGITAMNYLTQSFADRNRDNPPEPIVPLHVALVQHGNMAAGNNLREPTNSLRLNPSGQTPYPQLPTAELTVQSIVDVFGLLLRVDWAQGQAAGTRLLSLPAAPLIPSDGMSHIISNTKTFNVVPPVGVIASLFKQWRGELEFKFDFISNAFYSGSVLVAFIPGGSSSSSVDIAKSSHHVVFELQENNSFTFVVPYITDRPWWPATINPFSTDRNVFAPGVVNMYVINPLALMDALPCKIEINVYMRAGKTFEVSVPITPVLSSSLYPQEYAVQADDSICNQSKYWISNSRYFYGDKKGLFRYNAGDGDCNFNNIRTDGYYFTSKTLQMRKDYAVKDWTSVNLVPLKFAVPFQADSGEFWLVPVKDEQAAINWLTKQDDSGFVSVVDDNDEDASHSETIVTGDPPWHFKRHVVEAQGGERELSNIIVDSDSIGSTRFGHLTFGESFNSLTDLLRRFVPYARLTLPPVDGCNIAVVKMYIRPMGPFKLDAGTGNMNVREGPTAIICSGFPYFRGSMRLRFVFSASPQGTTVWIQHRPDDRIKRNGDVVVNYKTTKLARSYHRYCPGYATYMQDISQNCIVNVEVPYYKDSVYVSVPMVVEANNTKRFDLGSLGSVVLGFVNGSTQNITCSVYSSFGDDARLECFQGFPPMRYTNTLANNVDPIADRSYANVILPSEQTEIMMGVRHWAKRSSDYLRVIAARPQADEPIDDVVVVEEPPVVEEVPVIEEKVQEKDSLNSPDEEMSLDSLRNIASSRKSENEDPPLTVDFLISFAKEHPVQGGDTPQLYCIRNGLTDVTTVQSNWGQLFKPPVGELPPFKCDAIKKVEEQKPVVTQGAAVTKLNDTASAVINLDKKTTEAKNWFSKAPDLWQNIKNGFGDIESYISKDAFISILGQIAQCVNNPDVITLSIAGATVLCHVLRVGFDYLTKLVSSIVKAFTNCFDSSSEQKEKVKAQAQDDNEVSMAEFCATFISVIGAAIGYKCLPTTTALLPSLVKGFSMIGLMGRGFDYLTKFINLLFRMAKKVLTYFSIRKTDDFVDVHALMDQHGNDMRAWHLSCEELLDVSNREKLTLQATFGDVLFDRLMRGNIYLAQLATCDSKTPTLYPFVKGIVDRLHALRDDVVRMGNYPLVRSTPYHLWIYGGTGLGKSSMALTIADALLSAINFKPAGAPLYKFEPANNHWDTCNNEPIIYMDDAMAITTDEFVTATFQAMINLVNNMPFTPPMAELSSKKMRLNPKAFIVLANHCEIAHTSIKHEDALYRRRNMLVEVRPRNIAKVIDGTEHIIEVYDPINKRLKWDVIKEHLTEEQIANREFLTINLFEHVFPAGMNRANAFRTLDFKTWIAHLQADFVEHEKKEHIRVNNDLKVLHRIMDVSGMDLSSMEDTIDAHLKVLTDRYAEQFEKTNLMVSSFDKDQPEQRQGIQRWKADWPKRVPPPPKVAKPEALFDLDVSGMNEDFQKKWKEMRPFLACVDSVYLVPEPKFDKIERNRYQSVRTLPNQWAQQMGLSIDELQGIYEITTRNEVTDEEHIFRHAVISPDKITKQQVIKLQKLMAEFGKVFGRRLAEINVDRCRHFIMLNACPCMRVLEGASFDFLVPCCDRCITAGMRPVSMIACDRDCMLLASDLPDTKFGTKLTKYSQRRTHFCTFMKDCAASIFREIVLVIQDLSRATVKGLAWTLKQACKVMIKFVLPPIMTVGVFVGLTYYRKDKKRTLKESISTGAAAAGAMYTHFIDCVVHYGKDGKPTMLSNPQNITYDQSSATTGSQKEVKNFVVKALGQAPDHDDPVKWEDWRVNYADSVVRLVERNTYHLRVEYLSEQIGLASYNIRGIFVRGRVFLTLKHSWDEFYVRAKLKEGNCYIIQMPQVRLPFLVDNVDVRVFENSNFVLLHLPASIPEHRNLIKHMPWRKDHDRIIRRGILVEIKDKTREHILDLKYAPVVRIDKTPNSPSVMIDGAYEYPYGGSGVCGSALLAYGVNNCFIGVHVAGFENGKCGFAEPLCKEMFGEKFVTKEVADIQEPALLPVDLQKIDLNASILTLGTVSPQFEHRESGITSIVPSLCHGIFPVETEPGVLHPSDSRIASAPFSPMQKGCEKLGMPIIGFPRDLISFAGDCLRQQLRAFVKPVIPLEPLTLKRAVEGFPGIGGAGSLNFHTSEGHPWSSFRPAGYSDKRWMFDLELGQDGYICKGIIQPLVEQMSIKQAMREANIKPQTVFVDCLKDARLPKAKAIKPGGTRIFSISPIDFTIQFRQYFLTYTVAHQAARNENFSAVGINVRGIEWTRLVYKMVGNSPHQLCGDYSNFGSGFSAEVHHEIIDVLMDWFHYNGDTNPVNERVRRIMLSELVNSVHLCFNLVYQVFCGMPSGSPITVETNDLVNFCYVLMAWRELTSATKYCTFYYFRKFVQIKTYGDDLWLSVSPYVIDIFNNVSISNFFNKYGVKYTDASKGDDIVPYRDIFEAQFLKCNIVPHPFRDTIFISKLDTRSALDIANWCWRSNDMVEATLVNLTTCSDAFYGHGPEYHERVRRILMKVAHDLGVVGNFRRWKELDHLYLNIGETRDIM